jgi:hypothetical protein
MLFDSSRTQDIVPAFNYSYYQDAVSGNFSDEVMALPLAFWLNRGTLSRSRSTP